MKFQNPILFFLMDAQTDRWTSPKQYVPSHFTKIVPYISILALNKYSIDNICPKSPSYHWCGVYEGQSKITEPYLITFESSKMDIYLDDISLKLYVIYLII